MIYGNTIVVTNLELFKSILKMKQLDTRFSSKTLKKSYGHTFFQQKINFKSIMVTLQKITFIFGNFIQVFYFGHFKNVHFQKPTPTFKNFVST
jgi:hypothetical protein